VVTSVSSLEPTSPPTLALPFIRVVPSYVGGEENHQFDIVVGNRVAFIEKLPEGPGKIIFEGIKVGIKVKLEGLGQEFVGSSRDGVSVGEDEGKEEFSENELYVGESDGCELLA
jgi:hypothetical protein